MPLWDHDDVRFPERTRVAVRKHIRGFVNDLDRDLVAQNPLAIEIFGDIGVRNGFHMSRLTGKIPN
jgi:hypothetical protein